MWRVGQDSLPFIVSLAAGSSAQGCGRGDAMADLPMYVGSRIMLARGADHVTVEVGLCTGSRIVFVFGDDNG
eukprot:14520392-Alexandrium_andersonii.AAC.1